MLARALGTASVLNRVRSWGAKRLLGRVHRITHRMPAELRTVAAGKVLVLAPHMDDEVIAPGGTLALHKAAGSSVQVIYVSDSCGTAFNLTATRTAEARHCAALMQFDGVEFWNYPDGHLSRNEEAIAARLAAHLRTAKPDVIFAPFPTDHHRDHQATAAALGEAVRRSGWNGEVWGYEVWSTLWPNAIVEITAQVDAKRKAIECHASQVHSMCYVEAALGLNRYRGLRVGVPFAEAYYVAPANEYIRLTDELLGRV